MSTGQRTRFWKQYNDAEKVTRNMCKELFYDLKCLMSVWTLFFALLHVENSKELQIVLFLL